MVAELGQLSLLLGFALCIYMIVLGLWGGLKGLGHFVRSAQTSLYVTCGLVTVAMLSLWYYLLTSNFNIAYVAQVSNRDLSLFYKIGSLWAGQAGSLLLWTWLVTIYGSLAVYFSGRRQPALLPYVIVGIACTTGFFLAMNLFAANPFERLTEVLPDGRSLPFEPADGRGLNPLLHHPAMMIHPPVLYLGYVGFVVPFAFAIAALFTHRLGAEWTRSIRRWTLVPWFFLGTGIILGGRWAYVELGWGGYWAWDPVENASIMPWFTGTAFLHSMMVQERRGMLKVWNFVLIIATYLLCLFGTFLTRSGVVSSVHAFAQSAIGPFFIVFITAAAVASFGLLILRLKDLKSEHRLDSVVSRESTFLFNNLLLLLACFAVLWGTMFPVLSEAVTGEKITVGPPFFNRIFIPIALLLMFLMGAGPLLAWRKTSPGGLRKNFTIPTLAALVGLALSWLAGARSFYTAMSFALSAFVVAGIVVEFHRGLRARHLGHRESYPEALINLFRKHQRRYGGYLVHFGIVVLALGLTGAAFNTDKHADLDPGESMTLGPYTLRVNQVRQDASTDPNFAVAVASVDVLRGDQKVTTVHPEKRFYYLSEQQTSEVRIYSTWKEDLYVVLAGLTDTGGAALQVYLNPLVSLVWLGAIIMFLGTLVCLIPPLQGQEATVVAGAAARRQVLQPTLEADA